MGDPTKIGQAGLGATAGGSIMSAFGALSSGFANSNMFSYQAGIANLRAQIAQQNAEFAVQTGEQQSALAGMSQAQTMGKVVAAQSTSGTDVNSGSNKQIRSSLQSTNQLDTTIIRSNAAKTAYGFQTDAAVDTAQASVYSSAATNSLVAGAMGFGSSILSGIGSVSGEWLQGNKVGLWGSQAAGSTGSNNIDVFGGAQ